jgi:nickel/cobalt exporter
MVTAGVIATLCVRQVSRRWYGFSSFARRAHYFSSAVIICVVLYVSRQGLSAVSAAGAI